MQDLCICWAVAIINFLRSRSLRKISIPGLLVRLYREVGFTPATLKQIKQMLSFTDSSCNSIKKQTYAWRLKIDYYSQTCRPASPPYLILFYQYLIITRRVNPFSFRNRILAFLMAGYSFEISDICLNSQVIQKYYVNQLEVFIKLFQNWNLSLIDDMCDHWHTYSTSTSTSLPVLILYWHIPLYILFYQTDGRLLFVTPMDPLYLILPYLMKSGIEVRSNNQFVSHFGFCFSNASQIN